MAPPTSAAMLWDDDIEPATAPWRTVEATELRRGADIVVIGAGFTGLWTAFHLLERDPHLRVMVLESQRVGFGASGRNGGWCTPEIPLSLDEVDRRHGPGSAATWRRALVDTVHHVRHVCATEGIDAHWADGGWLQWARDPAQEQRIRALVQEYRRHGFDEQAMRWMDPDEAGIIAQASGVRGASFSAETAALHPGRLVRGLAAAVERRGGVIAEGMRVDDVRPHAAVVGNLHIPARWVIRATEAYSVRLAKFRRSVAPVYSMMIATAPLSTAQWETVGLTRRTVFNDARRTVIYGQRTADGRLAFGGRGAPYHFGSTIDPRFDTHELTRRHLATALTDLFPDLGEVEVTHHWGGPLGVARDWHPSVGVDTERGWAWAGGYVGEGVAAAALAGRTLTELITNQRSERTDVAWVGHRSRRWEPEPLRWLGINAMARLASYADRRSASTGRSPRVVDAVLGRLLGH